MKDLGINDLSAGGVRCVPRNAQSRGEEKKNQQPSWRKTRH